MLYRSKLRRHILAGVTKHADELATMLDKIPFFTTCSAQAGWFDEHGVWLSWYLLDKPPVHAAQVYVHVACETLIVRGELGTLQRQDVFDRFGLYPIFDSHLDLWPRTGKAPLPMRISVALDRMAARIRPIRLSPAQQRWVDTLSGAVAVVALQILAAVSPDSPVARIVTAVKSLGGLL